VSVYARIVDGVVAELFTPQEGFTLQDSMHPDLVWNDVTSVEGISQNWTATETNGVWTYAAPVIPGPTIATQALISTAAGMQITSTTAGISGTYPCDPTTQSKLANVALYVQANGKFPAGLTSFPVFDITGTTHLFTTTTEFLALVSKMGDYVTEIDLFAAGAVQNLPAQPVSIP
jgi:hypothetical protein